MANCREERCTRIALLQFIKVKGRAAIQEMSGAFGIPRAVASRHPMRLQTAGLVQAEKIQPQRGCPTDAYLLTELGDSLFPKVYGRFFSDLLR